MRNKKIFYFDEEKEAENIIKNGFENNILDYTKMYIIAKYYREKQKLGEIRLERKLIKFCKKQNPNFNPVLEAKALKKWVKSAMRYRLRKIKEIPISQKEIDFLRTIKTDKDRKILFMTLVFAKALKLGNTRRKTGEYKTSDNHYIRYNNFLDIIRLSELTNLTEVKFAKILHQYKEYFLFYNAEFELIRLEYVDKNPQKIIMLTNLDNLVKHYIDIFGKNMTYCEICGKEIEKKVNNQKYCPECAIKEKYRKTNKYKRDKRKETS